MRNKDRIYETIWLFTRLWSKLPDFRFFQLVSYIAGEGYNKYKIDPFFIEEDKWNEVLREMIKRTN